MKALPVYMPTQTAHAASVEHDAAARKVRISWESAGEFLSDIGELEAEHSPAKHNDVHGWAGTATYEEAEALMLNGWREGAERVERLSETLQGKIRPATRPRMTYVHGEHGDEVDVDRYLAGETECMLTPTPRQSTGLKMLTVGVELGSHSGVTVETMAQRGAAVLALVDALELRGYRCAVVGYVTTHHHATNAGTYDGTLKFGIKRHGESVDLDRLAYVLMHASFLRRHVFAWWESNGQAFRDASLGASYGSPESSEETFRAEHGTGAVWSGKLGRSYDDAEALKWVDDALTSLGAV